MLQDISTVSPKSKASLATCVFVMIIIAKRTNSRSVICKKGSMDLTGATRWAKHSGVCKVPDCFCQGGYPKDDKPENHSCICGHPFNAHTIVSNATPAQTLGVRGDEAVQGKDKGKARAKSASATGLGAGTSEFTDFNVDSFIDKFSRTPAALEASKPLPSGTASASAGPSKSRIVAAMGETAQMGKPKAKLVEAPGTKKTGGKKEKGGGSKGATEAAKLVYTGAKHIYIITTGLTKDGGLRGPGPARAEYEVAASSIQTYATRYDLCVVMTKGEYGSDSLCWHDGMDEGEVNDLLYPLLKPYLRWIHEHHGAEARPVVPVKKTLQKLARLHRPLNGSTLSMIRTPTQNTDAKCSLYLATNHKVPTSVVDFIMRQGRHPSTEDMEAHNLLDSSGSEGEDEEGTRSPVRALPYVLRTRRSTQSFAEDDSQSDEDEDSDAPAPAPSQARRATSKRVLSPSLSEGNDRSPTYRRSSNPKRARTGSRSNPPLAPLASLVDMTEGQSDTRAPTPVVDNDIAGVASHLSLDADGFAQVDADLESPMDLDDSNGMSEIIQHADGTMSLGMSVRRASSSGSINSRFAPSNHADYDSNLRAH
ncbi:hypothetical protein PENSPDRAFT_672337 [Peniophora sp. CONT]|nr:hypothetical protein PENSPDRAFT_672337 [Peniophora sp. CONT]